MNKSKHIGGDMIRTVLLILGVVLGLFIVLNQAQAQEKNPYVYGDVKTVSGKTYTGLIKWGTNSSSLAEMLWVEVFNGAKRSNNFLKYLSNSEKEALSKEEGDDGWLGLGSRLLNIWEDKYSRTTHSFSVRFGDIKSIRPSGRSVVEVTMKNGVTFEVSAGNAEDVGSKLTVYDFELGEISLDRDKIDIVSFKEAPASVKPNEGSIIIAKVNAGRKGTFEGVIQWDSDERFGSEVIDGETREGKREIPLRAIQRIEKLRNGSAITLKSGRTLELSGSNDVNNENRGIIIHDKNIGYVKVPWRDFMWMEVTENESLLMSYNDFQASKGLIGTIRTIDGDEHRGLIAYDLDEAWDYELLDGNDDKVEYQIPFANIKSIIPKNYNYSMVELKNGESLLVGGTRDVSEDNDGVLIFDKNNQPVYIKWSEIDEIIFD